MFVSGHFQEACAVELPSQLHSYSYSSSSSSRKNSSDDDNKYTRLATEYHAVEISMNYACGSMEVTTNSLPNHDFISNQSCIAHSYLSIGDDHDHNEGNNNKNVGGYLEAFILRVIDGGIISAARKQNSGAATSDDQKDILFQSNNSNSNTALSLASGDGKLDDDTNNSKSASKQTGSNEQRSTCKYCIVIRGYLPMFDDPVSTGRGDTPLSSAELDQGDGIDHDGANVNSNIRNEPNIQLPTGRKGKGHSGSTRTAANNINVEHLIPLPLYASTIELCHVKINDKKAQNEPEKDEISTAMYFAMFIAEGSEIKMFSLKVHLDHISSAKDNVSSDSSSNVNGKGNNEAIFHIEETTMAPHETSNESESLFSDEFMSFIEREAPRSIANTSPLSFSTPINIITSLVQSKSDADSHPIHTLSVGCQDGSIRIILFNAKLTPSNQQHPSFKVIQIFEFIIDGPISSLSYSYYNCDNDNQLILFAGSLCGVACYFTQKNSSSGIKFDGAYPLIDGLWDARLNDEDGVLSICEFHYGGVDGGKIIALGTNSGRLLLFAKAKNLGSSGDLSDRNHCGDISATTNFYCVWHCNLQNPVCDIHGITSRSGLMADMVVCTKRHVHLLRSNPHYIAEATFERVEQLLHKFLSD